jgi:hypothetical protein
VTVRFYRYYKEWGSDTDSELREYFDTNNPYKLIAEAKEARELLDRKFIQGHEFEDQWGNSIRAHDDPRIRTLCSIGAVYYVQGHQAYECNLIQALNKNTTVVHPGLSCPNEDCECEDHTIVSVNDSMGKDAALAVFDYTISEYQAEIDLAEGMAAQYADKPYNVTPFTFTNTPVPVVLEAVKAKPAPVIVKEEVNV